MSRTRMITFTALMFELPHLITDFDFFFTLHDSCTFDIVVKAD